MVARSDSDQHDFEDWGSINGLLPPWSDDQTTTAYSESHLPGMQRPQRMITPATSSTAWNAQAEPMWRDTSSSWDSSPQIIEISDARRVPTPVFAQAAGGGGRSMGRRTLQAVPPPPRPVTQSGYRAPAARSGVHMAPAIPGGPRRAQPPSATSSRARAVSMAPLSASHRSREATLLGMPRHASATGNLPPSRALPMLDLDARDEASPFERSGVVRGASVHAAAAAVGLFGAVLFGRVLIDASPIRPEPSPVLLSAPSPLPEDTRVIGLSAEANSALTAAAIFAEAPASATAAYKAGRFAKAPRTAATIAANPIAANASAANPIAANAMNASAVNSSPRRELALGDSASDASDASVQRAERAEAAREAAEARREAAEAKREAARAHAEEVKAQREAEKQARREEVEARREAAQAQREEAKERPADAAPAASGKQGTLRINSRPWAEVYVDGRLVGNTPQLGIDVPAGKHTVRLVNTQFSMSKIINLNVAAGESVTRVELLDE